MRRLACVLLFALLLAPRAAHAIGWDSDDFLIGGGEGFPSKIGVFNHDLTFKGYLDTGFVGVSGMDFDAQGRLAAVAWAVRSVRVYSSEGTNVGGFTRTDDLLGTPGDLKVAPDGTYILGTQDFGGGSGARQFMTDGTFVRQYASGSIIGVAVIPGNKIWIGGVNSSFVRVFNLADGSDAGALPIVGLTTASSMHYSADFDSVLITDIPSGTVIECDLMGHVMNAFIAPNGSPSLNKVTRGPDGDVFATAGESVLHWRSDGLFLGFSSMSSSLGLTSGIVWVGNAPEPSASLIILISLLMPYRRWIRRKT